MQRLFAMFTSLALSAFLSAAVIPFHATAQTAQPITSLPRAPGDTDIDTAPPQAQAPVVSPQPAPTVTEPQPPAPRSDIHPITSLPKAPGDTSYTPPALPDTYSVPTATAPAVTPPPAIVPSPAPDAAPATEPPPQPAPAAPETPTTTPFATQLPPTPTYAPAQPAPDLDPHSLHASLDPEPQPVPVQTKPVRKPIRAFSTAAIALKIGVAGVGIDVATPLSQRFNLRAGGSYYPYNGTFNVDGMTITGQARLRSGTASLDWFPFHGNFHLSPGITFYNGNTFNTKAYVPSGGAFSLADGDYISDPTGVDPVHGTFDLSFGRHVAPNFTIGFGNMIPRSGRHFSFPFEIGFQYIGPPKLTLNLAGTVCSNQPNNQGCEQLQTDPDALANLAQEQVNINNDIKPLRFYPILSQGFSYRF